MPMQQPGEYQHSSDMGVAPTLKELGITHNQSSDWKRTDFDEKSSKLAWMFWKNDFFLPLSRKDRIYMVFSIADDVLVVGFAVRKIKSLLHLHSYRITL